MMPIVSLTFAMLFATTAGQLSATVKPMARPTPRTIGPLKPAIAVQLPKGSSPRSTMPVKPRGSTPADLTVIGSDRLKAFPVPKPTPTVAERKLAACKAAKGAWYAEITGVKLEAKGSDVDEIYGRIYVTNTSGGKFVPWRHAPGWEPNNLWKSDENKNLGKYPITAFPRLKIVNLWGAERHNAKIRVHFDLRDEDDGRGGSNDEYFTIYGTIGSYKGPDNSVEFPFTIPDCDESPEFTKGAHYSVFGAPIRQGEKNVVTFRVAVHAMRKFP